MRVLVVTGKLAEESAKSISSKTDSIDVLTVPVSVAAFITPEIAAKTLKEFDLKAYDIILLPGTVRGDVSPVESATEVPTFKGPLTINEIPYVIDLLGKIELSKTISASEFIRKIFLDRATIEIEEVEKNWQKIIRKQNGLVIGKKGKDITVGQFFPMRVIAEIVNAPTLKDNVIKRRARYYESEGADIIDIGMLANKPMPNTVERLINTVRSTVDLPVSIDTIDVTEIEAAVNSDIDLVLSIDRGNMEELANVASETPVVVLPSNIKQGVMPQGAEKRVAGLKENITLARSFGFKKIIADPVLEPVLVPGLMESLRGYQRFRMEDTHTPVLFGLGNVTELIDVDSVGVNGLLTALACEVGADLLFIPEHSPKTKGSVHETSTASKMMFLAKKRQTYPKDLGIQLLVLKEKRWVEEAYEWIYEDNIKVVDCSLNNKFHPDSKGWFQIKIDRDNGLLIAIHFSHGHEAPNIIIRGRNPKEVYQTIIENGLIDEFNHAAYLGMELKKAELALKLGKSYVQDRPLFL